MPLAPKAPGGRKARPKLASIGGKSWLKQKKAADIARRRHEARVRVFVGSRAGSEPDGPIENGDPVPVDAELQRRVHAGLVEGQRALPDAVDGTERDAG